MRQALGIKYAALTDGQSVCIDAQTDRHIKMCRHKFLVFRLPLLSHLKFTPSLPLPIRTISSFVIQLSLFSNLSLPDLDSTLIPHIDANWYFPFQEDEVGPRWQPNQSPYTCAVSSPRKENKYHGIKSYISYAGEFNSPPL